MYCLTTFIYLLSAAIMYLRVNIQFGHGTWWWWWWWWWTSVFEGFWLINANSNYNSKWCHNLYNKSLCKLICLSFLCNPLTEIVHLENFNEISISCQRTYAQFIFSINKLHLDVCFFCILIFFGSKYIKCLGKQSLTSQIIIKYLFPVKKLFLMKGVSYWFFFADKMCIRNTNHIVAVECDVLFKIWIYNYGRLWFRRLERYGIGNAYKLTILT